jgi:hypothetical protein
MAAGRPSKRASAELQQAYQVDELLKMVVAGMSIKRAAEHLGIAQSTANRWYHDALRKVYDDNATLREEVLGKELKTLDLLQRALWPAALRGHVRSVEVMLSVMDRRAKYLGLDAAVKIQVEATRVDEALAKVASIIDAETVPQAAPLLRAVPRPQ